MMLPHCMRWDISTQILDKEGAVAAAFCDGFISGDFKLESDVLKLKDCQTVTMDLEAVSLEGLKGLEREGVHVAPSSKVIGLIQNKIRQKEFFKENGLPTAPFKVLDKVTADTPSGFLKLPEGGYDGKGVVAFHGKMEELPKEFLENILWEEKASIKCELSVLVARNRYGEIKVYEPTEMAFDPSLNLISYTLYPARLSPNLSDRAKSLAESLMEKLEGEGVLAVEMFLTEKDELWVNELAPRPHNSGHHSIESCLTSQFENHLRGVLGFPLGEVDLIKKALTFNIIGEGNGRSQWSGLNELMGLKGAYLHNYGKKDCREGRKMGHVTLIGDSYEELIENYQYLSKKIKVKGSHHE